MITPEQRQKIRYNMDKWNNQFDPRCHEHHVHIKETTSSLDNYTVEFNFYDSSHAEMNKITIERYILKDINDAEIKWHQLSTEANFFKIYNPNLTELRG